MAAPVADHSSLYHFTPLSIPRQPYRHHYRIQNRICSFKQSYYQNLYPVTIAPGDTPDIEPDHRLL